jgi:hypothetical protein
MVAFYPGKQIILPLIFWTFFFEVEINRGQAYSCALALQSPAHLPSWLSILHLFATATALTSGSGIACRSQIPMELSSNGAGHFIIKKNAIMNIQQNCLCLEKTEICY